jgi:hypothetical protein
MLTITTVIFHDRHVFTRCTVSQADKDCKKTFVILSAPPPFENRDLHNLGRMSASGRFNAEEVVGVKGNNGPYLYSDTDCANTPLVITWLRDPEYPEPES